MEKIIALISAMIFVCISIILVKCTWDLAKIMADDVWQNNRQGYFVIIDFLICGFVYYFGCFVGHLIAFLYSSTAGIFTFFWNV